MRDLLIARLLKVLYWHGAPIYGSMRWNSVFEYIALEIGIDPSTKAGRKKMRELDLSLTDFSTFDDAKLIELFELVCRRANVCM